MKDQINLDALFHKASNQPVVSSFGETKELFLSTVGTVVVAVELGKTSLFTLKKLMIMILVFTAIISSIMFLQDGTRNSTNKTSIPQKRDLGVPSDSNRALEEAISLIPLEQLQSKKILEPLIRSKKILEANIQEKMETIEILTNEEFDFQIEEPKRNQPYIFPILTEKQIAANNRRKEKTMKDLRKLSKSKLFNYIPSGSFKHEGKVVSVQSFYMQKTEVTNGQYRTFLFDLLIQDRKEDFLIAKPNQALWTEELGIEMKMFKDNYFSGSEYSSHPVNNISRAGAELYCNWLTLELAKYTGSENILVNDFRIPQRAEWMIAASHEGNQMPYPWFNDELTYETRKGLDVFSANFRLNSYSGDLDTLNCNPLGDTSSLSSNAYIYGNTQPTTKVWKSLPNGNGLYHMSGNVAEMVYNKDKSSGTAGGGWMSSEDEIKLDGADPYSRKVDADLNIGFRVVMTYVGTSK